MPEGYSPQRQVLIHSIQAYWLPAYGAQVAGVLVFLAGSAGLYFIRRRRNRAVP